MQSVGFFRGQQQSDARFTPAHLRYNHRQASHSGRKTARASIISRRNASAIASARWRARCRGASARSADSCAGADRSSCNRANPLCFICRLLRADQAGAADDDDLHSLPSLVDDWRPLITIRPVGALAVVTSRSSAAGRENKESGAKPTRQDKAKCGGIVIIGILSQRALFAFPSESLSLS